MIPASHRLTRLVKAAVAVLLSASLNSADAQSLPGKTNAFLTADQLLSLCRLAGHSPADPSPAAMLYLMGVADSQALAQSDVPNAAFCLPDGTGQATLASTVCTYLDGHASDRGFTGVSFAYAALRSSFPCR